MKSSAFPNIAILGLGLIGGSIALDLKRRGLAKRVVGYNRSEAGRREALKRGACDVVFAKPELAVKDADLVILATPVQSIPMLARKISRHLKPGCLVTDVGSTKSQIVRRLGKLLGRKVFFIGGHPIAGTERSGMSAAELDLFQGRRWILTPNSKSKAYQSPLKKLMSLCKALGAKTFLLSPEDHDAILARVSHLPHMIAFALLNATEPFQRGRALGFAGSSFKDATRVAQSPAEMWRDISLDNREALLQSLKDFKKSLGRLESQIRRSQGKKLESFFKSAAEVRSRL